MQNRNCVISVEHLSKRYRIGGHERHITIRDQLDDFIRHPFGVGKHTPPREEFWALKSVSFAVERGDVVGIIGRNGSGKSTLLKILSRIVEPTEGKAVLRGKVSSLLEIGTGFNQELTGRENIYLNGSILGMRKKEIDKKFDQILEFSGVEQFMDTPVKRYSSGMYVRLAFAVAAHLDADILLVDEVLAVGDMQFQKKCLGKMNELAGSGKTVIFVSHDLNAVRKLCRTGIWLHDGKIMQSGLMRTVGDAYEKAMIHDQVAMSPTVVRETPRTPFYIQKVELRNSRDIPKCDFLAGDVLHFHLWLNQAAPANNFTVEFQLHNSTGRVVSFGAANPVTDVYFKKTDRHITCALGPLPLTSGEYRLSFSVRVWKKVRWDTWNDAISFTITRSDLFRTGHDIPSGAHGDFVIQQQWKAL